MAQSTKQTQTTGGSDGLAHASSVQGKTTSVRQTGPSSRRSQTVSQPVKTIQETPATTRTTTEALVGQDTLNEEDFAFTMSFSIVIKSSLPCEEQS